MHLKPEEHQRPANMPFGFGRRRRRGGVFYSKPIGGRHFGTSVRADKHGVHRGPWRFSLGKFSCFKRH